MSKYLRWNYEGWMFVVLRGKTEQRPKTADGSFIELEIPAFFKSEEMLRMEMIFRNLRANHNPGDSCR